MYNDIAYLMAATGDSSKPLLVAVCLIVSVILMVVLILTGKSMGRHDNDENDDPEE